jgi:hypothetical protein
VLRWFTRNSVNGWLSPYVSEWSAMPVRFRDEDAVTWLSPSDAPAAFVALHPAEFVQAAIGTVPDDDLQCVRYGK